jgi:GWxTD domain-containing protein
MFIEKYQPEQAGSQYTRAGYEMLPYPVNIFPSNRNTLIFYQEIYQLSQILSDSIFYITIGIQDLKGKVLDAYQHTYKENTASFIPVLTEIDIKDLAAGQYFLTIQLFKKNTELIAEKKTFFIRTRATLKRETDNYQNADIEGTFAARLPGDSLFFWLESLSPIASPLEKEMIQHISKEKDSIAARKFFFCFWHHIAAGSENEEWQLYKNDVEAVEYNFSTPIRHGFETDRGRVYLQYGKPDRRHVMNSEPGALPYEIWQYYRISSGQANVMFVFYLPGLATNDYRLIHSDVNGELRDSRWKYKIYNSMKEMSGYSNPDNTNIRDHWGKRIDQIINW